MEEMTESSWDLVITELSKTKAGTIILCAVVITVTLLPFWKWLYSVYKEKKAEIMKKKEEKKKADEELRLNIKNISEHLPELDRQVLNLSAEFSSLKQDLTKTSNDLNQKIDTLKSDIQESTKKNEVSDRQMSEKLNATQLMINSMQATTDKIVSDIGVLFDGENNEFRIYITQLHARHVENNEPMTRAIRQELRIKFESYDNRGGNGWAKQLYEELMSLPIAHEFHDEL